jgi:methylglutaconyl-CoA hydratase
MNETGTVQTVIQDGIARITFFHPQSNALPLSLLKQLSGEITQAGQDPQVRVIVLQSQGEKVFCAGASFDELQTIANEDEGRQFFSGFASVINAMRKAPVFIIARIQGKAVGGGVGLAAAADYALAHQSASVKLSELSVGIGPFVVGPAIERKTGKAAFTTLAMDATTWRSAQWACQVGLYADIYPDLTLLDEAVNGLACQLAGYHPAAMAQLKKIFWEGTDHWDQLLAERAAISGRLILSDYSQKAIEKFKQQGKNK